MENHRVWRLWGGPLAATCLCFGSCAAPKEGRLELSEVRASLAERSSPESLEATIDALALPPSVLRIPASADRKGPAQPGYWFVQALAWSPSVRAARRQLAAATAEAKSAGAPNPIAIQAVDHELGGDDKLVEAIGVLDLVGLLGLGPSGAERERASAEAQLALGQLERAAFDATLGVERARIRTVAARTRHARFVALEAEAKQDLERVAILERNDRLSSADARLARAEVARIERQVSLSSVALGSARRDLAALAGSMPATHRAEFSVDVLAVGAEGLAELGKTEAAGTPLPIEELAAQHPALREARLVFAVREAQVREAASRAWPGIGLGPHLGYLDSARIGAVLRLAVPFPSSWRGKLEAAVQRRDRSIESFEEALQALLVKESEALTRIDQLLAMSAVGVGATDRAMLPALEHWTAARAVFRSGRGPLSGWTKALNHLTETVTWSVDDAEALALARVDLLDARGPLLSSTPGMGTPAP